jgi:hypothetical protein
MKLYHYTTAENAFLIAVRGLSPGIHANKRTGDAIGAYQTMGQPVVWLTREESNLVTAEHVAHFQKLGDNLGLKIGDILFGGPVRCTVELGRHDKRLMRWTDFLQTTKIIGASPDNPGEWVTGRDVLRGLQGTVLPAQLTGWWIYTGDIPSSKIETGLTAATALPGCDFQIATHPNPEARERFKIMRDELAAADPDTPISFNVLSDAA